MEERGREIEVRSLTGESTSVFVEPNNTIQDLKLLLKQTFNPAKTFPNFHLFLKGFKLGLKSQISSHSIESGDFVVLVPFIKNSRPQIQKSGQPKTYVETPDQSPSSKFVDSVWSDMVQDFSNLQDDLSNENNEQKNDSANMFGSNTLNLESKSNRDFDGNRQDGCMDNLLRSILQSPNKDVLDVQNCEGFIKFLDLANCLSYQYSGNCMLLSKISLLGCDKLLPGSNNNFCLCPSWLKNLVKAFACVNIVSGFLELQQKKITSKCLKEVLIQLGKYGIHVDMGDLKHLSVLCPKIIHFCNNEREDTKFEDCVVIINLTEERSHSEENSSSAQKQISVTRIANTIKKREIYFKTNLWEAIKLLVHKYGNDVSMFFSLEELLAVVERDAHACETETKRARRSSSTATRCHDTNSLRPVEMIEHLKNGIGSQGQMVHVEDIGARKAIHVDIPNELPESIKSALKSTGITKLYSHQAESIRASLSGKNVVVATMTSSGKSLCYNLPVLELLSRNLLSCALYLFPTKALAQDQLRAFLAMTKGSDSTLNIGVYDGDTSLEDRMWLRDNARLLITNPDMLHVSILPFHGQFRRILTNLRYVVIDEAHAYKGALGCHTALILRRLRRICSHVYGSDPSFVFCTATSANPREHCMELANLPDVELIQNDGSPYAQKLFILWNPIINQNTLGTSKSADRKDSVRCSSPIMEASWLFAEMVQHGLRCITFCGSRKLCELVLSYTCDILREAAPHLVDSICSYRAGYTVEDRRRIERDFFGGRLCGIAATNALELGIDVGHIDVTLHLGFPGSISSLWQQAGRAGRRDRPSLAVYVAFGGPLDQYYMKFPEKLFKSAIECFHIDAQSPQVLERHLVCAAFEHPLNLHYDKSYFGSCLESAIMSLSNRGYLSSDPSLESSARIWNYVGHEKMPSRTFGIRAIETERYKVIDKKKDEVIEEIEESKAFFQVYEGAVYMNQGKTYLITKLDISSKLAYCQEADLKYYTKTRDYTDIKAIGDSIAYPARVSQGEVSRTIAQANACKVTTIWFGFRRIWRGSNQVFETVELSLPPYSYASQATWIRVPQSIKTTMDHQMFRAGLHAASHAVLNVVPLCVICNSSDLAPECANPHDTRYFPERILLYDQHPGGTGVSFQVQPHFMKLLTTALELITSCCCSGDTGCPNCIQTLACHEYNEVLHKEAAITIIKCVLDADTS